MAGVLQRGETAFIGRSRCQAGQRGKNGQGEADLLEHFRREYRCNATMRHIRHHRCVDGTADLAHFLLACQCLGKQDVGTGLGVQLKTPEHAIEALTLAGIGTRSDQEIAFVVARIAGHANFLRHVFGGNDAFVRRMAALLRKLLVLDLNHGDAGGLVAAHRMGDVEQSTEAGIGICDHGSAGDLHQRRHAIEHLRIGRQPHVGQSCIRGHHPVARAVDDFKADAAGYLGGNHVRHAGCEEELAGVEFVSNQRIRHAFVSC